ncbi:hypothetical protein A3Q56_00996 [Intoshia linei]|uniref:Uncharacterized protein n=1 Tax=Intoshia linei TaxID=1819745 RepID=A0A177BCH9_9BILA|nr:hypothetical protein A3Q56_00996 [Intoshia linei]
MYNKTIQNKKRECDILLDKLKYPDETDSEVNVNHLLSNHEKMKLMQLFDNYVVDKLKINRNRRIDSVEDKLQQIDQDKKNKIFSYVFKPLYSTVVNSVSKYNKESFMNSLKMVPENQALMAKIRADTIDAVLDLSESDIFDV